MLEYISQGGTSSEKGRKDGFWYSQPQGVLSDLNLRSENEFVLDCPG